MCNTHYERARLGRDVSAPIEVHRFNPVIDRIMGRIVRVPETGCWEYAGARTSAGYGHIGVAGKVEYTHRLMYEAANGPAEVVMHSCDNPPCCFPGHLVGGTQMDNLRDMAHKGRQWKQRR